MVSSFTDPKQIPSNTYTAKDIEVLEGLEAVRKRPGMYIGGTDEKALHHLVKEILDNAMDEVIAHYATEITVSVKKNNIIQISDNGRGIPIDRHPKFPDKSALEIILSTLHSGGKFTQKAYQYSGGLHGVGLSVVNALSESLEVVVIRDGAAWKQAYSRGKAISNLESIVSKQKKGTMITFKPDSEIFHDLSFNPEYIYQMVKAKAYLHRGVQIRWSLECGKQDTNFLPQEQTLNYTAGIEDFIKEIIPENEILFNSSIITGEGCHEASGTKAEWALLWAQNTYIQKTFCNTIETISGGTHESGFKLGIMKAFKHYAEILQIKKFNLVTIEDILINCNYILSTFVNEPEFQGQTKDKLVNKEVSKELEILIKNHLELWLSKNHKIAESLIAAIIDKIEERLSKKNQKNATSKSYLQKNPLIGKLTDHSRGHGQKGEIFILEGESAAGSARQARNSSTQAILPLRGKVLNVASNSQEKILANKELSDLELALGCGSLNSYSEERLRYEKVIIMTDADIDGAHIASLLMTFFFIRMPELVKQGHLYLARPPLYKLTQNNISFYAQNDKDKDNIIRKLSKKSSKIEINRFKGLGEMTASQLKETTMNPETRNLIKVFLPQDLELTETLVNNLMGKNPETRFQFIQEQALLKKDCLKESLDL
jgi:topoisomerase-4 subunit B